MPHARQGYRAPARSNSRWLPGLSPYWRETFGPATVLRTETRVWWGQAKRDLKIARLTHERRAYDAAVFFCEQAVQKSPKALIIHRTSKMPPRIHNLPELGRLVGFPADMSKFLAELQPHYIRTRYPDAAGAVTDELYDGRLSLHFLRGASKVLAWVRNRLR